MMWINPRNAHAQYPVPPPQAQRSSRASQLCWWIAGVAIALTVIGGIVFLVVRPSAEDEVLCGLGSLTACDNWRQDHFIHIFAAFATIGYFGLALISSFIGLILMLAGE